MGIVFTAAFRAFFIIIALLFAVTAVSALKPRRNSRPLSSDGKLRFHLSGNIMSESIHKHAVLTLQHNAHQRLRAALAHQNPAAALKPLFGKRYLFQN